MTKVVLSISSNRLDEEELQQIACDLSRDVNQETDITASLAEGESKDEFKGEPITLGVILLAFLTTGTAVALFNVLQSYFERNSSLTMEFEREDGKKLTISAENMNSSKIDRTILLAKRFFELKDE